MIRNKIWTDDKNLSDEEFYILFDEPTETTTVELTINGGMVFTVNGEDAYRMTLGEFTSLVKRGEVLDIVVEDTGAEKFTTTKASVYYRGLKYLERNVFGDAVFEILH